MIFYAFGTLLANAIMTARKQYNVLWVHKTNDAVGFVFVVDVLIFVFFFTQAVNFINLIYLKLLSMIKELLFNITQFIHILTAQISNSDYFANRNQVLINLSFSQNLNRNNNEYIL